MTTLFIKARCMAFVDVPNLFALPQPNMDELVPVEGGGQVHQAGVHHKAYGGQPNLDNISWQLKV